jgi:hypothetical protein
MAVFLFKVENVLASEYFMFFYFLLARGLEIMKYSLENIFNEILTQEHYRLY